MTTFDSIETAVAEHSVRNQILVTFCNSAYERVLLNWLAHLHRVGVSNYLVVALDDSLYSSLDKGGFHAVRGKNIDSVGSLWKYRVEVISRILSRGYAVIHSDTDAVWIRNPDSIFALETHDLLFSQGTVWPKDTHEEWGFVLCCGLFLLRPTESSISFCERWLKALDEDEDDQRTLNRLLINDKTVWDEETHYELQFGKQNIRCYANTLSGEARGMRIGMLPHRMFQRLADDQEAVYVMHPVSEKKQFSTIETLEAFDCWILSENSKGALRS